MQDGYTLRRDLRCCARLRGVWHPFRVADHVGATAPTWSMRVIHIGDLHCDERLCFMDGRRTSILPINSV
jgi:hypothetical protein